jgi:NADH dehydrogenase
VLFAGAHAYWASGGTVLLTQAQARSVTAQMLDGPVLATVGWTLLSSLFVAAGLFPLALSWVGGRRISRWVMEVGAVAGGYAGMAALASYGIAARDLGLVVVGGAVCLLGVVVARVRPPRWSGPRWTVVVTTWTLGVSMTLYGFSYAVAAGSAVGSPPFLGYLVVGGAGWLTGGLLFVATAWRATRRALPLTGSAASDVAPIDDHTGVPRRVPVAAGDRAGDVASPPRIVIVGGGHVGLSTALRIQRRLRDREATVTVIDPEPNMTYQPFLAEAAAGAIEVRHVMVPLRQVLHGCEVLTATVCGIDHDHRTLSVRPVEGAPFELPYDQVVLALGSVSRPLPIPGPASGATHFRTARDAVRLRDHILGRLDVAATTHDPDQRRRTLTFVFVGGGSAGVETFAELHDMARRALRRYPELVASDMRWVLVEATQRILPEFHPALAASTVERLRARGMDIRLDTVVESMVAGHVVLSDGCELDAETIVWTTGVRANPLASGSGLPVDATGRLVCDADLRVQGIAGAWGAGDCAAVPDLSRDEPGVTCAPTAQHAVRQAVTLADNVVAVLRGLPTRPYRHAHAGSVASLGLHRGVAEIYGARLTGLPAWLVHRVYHIGRIPTLDRKARIVTDWALALCFGRDLAAFHRPPRPAETNPERTVPRMERTHA